MFCFVSLSILVCYTDMLISSFLCVGTHRFSVVCLLSQWGQSVAATQVTTRTAGNIAKQFFGQTPLLVRHKLKQLKVTVHLLALSLYTAWITTHSHIQWETLQTVSTNKSFFTESYRRYWKCTSCMFYIKCVIVGVYRINCITLIWIYMIITFEFRCNHYMNVYNDNFWA